MIDSDIRNLMRLWDEYVDYRIEENLKWNKDNYFDRDISVNIGESGISFRGFMQWLEDQPRDK